MIFFFPITHIRCHGCVCVICSRLWCLVLCLCPTCSLAFLLLLFMSCTYLCIFVLDPGRTGVYSDVRSTSGCMVIRGCSDPCTCPRPLRSPLFPLYFVCRMMMSRHPIFISCFSPNLDLSIIDMYMLAIECTCISSFEFLNPHAHAATLSFIMIMINCNTFCNFVRLIMAGHPYIRLHAYPPAPASLAGAATMHSYRYRHRHRGYMSGLQST